eukprot:TRINITY_DN75352_c0_g1_i1.p1 TRINITY_DN75352_c0_g1~~TRINITY_DN75352_c0_g1_i1.p1  ORF type:complete len:224 (-),score=17.09 TRINITY_DN75352_c0_g1_i1:435-1106(-)
MSSGKWSHSLKRGALTPVDLCSAALYRDESSTERASKQIRAEADARPSSHEVDTSHHGSVRSRKNESHSRDSDSSDVDLVSTFTRPEASSDQRSSVCLSQSSKKRLLFAQRDYSELQVLFEKSGVRKDIAAELVSRAASLNVPRIQMRSILWNLRRNTSLLNSINSGSSSVDTVLTMSDHDLAAPIKRMQRQQICEEAMNACVLKDIDSFKVPCKSCGDTSAI